MSARPPYERKLQHHSLLAGTLLRSARKLGAGSGALGSWQCRFQLSIPKISFPAAKDSVGLSRAALEGLALEGVRSGQLSISQARRLLGIESRFEMDGFLKDHGVYLDLTLEAVRKDSEVAWIHHG